MTLNREQSLNFVENSSYIIKDLNETQLSHVTKESAEKDYKELESLIKAVREDRGNISILSSSKNMDKSNSIISNEEIWCGDRSPDDSKNFIKNFQNIENKKKMSIFKKDKKSEKIMKKTMSKKPNHLMILTPSHKKENEKEEDYNEDVDELIGSKKSEQVNQMINLETKINNLEEISMNNNFDQNNSYKFYTSPEDFLNYRSAYQNFSFTPGQNWIGENYFYQGQAGFPIFPTIPNSYTLKSGEDKDIIIQNIFSPKEEKSIIQEEVNLINKENLNIQTVNEKDQSQKLIKNKYSTRNSTESNESNTEMNFNNFNNGINVNNRKFYTPTHTNINRQYNITQVKRELDFGVGNSNITGNSGNNLPVGMSHVNKFNQTKNQNYLMSPIPLFSPTVNQNMKSLSFCANNVNNLKSPSTNVKSRFLFNEKIGENCNSDFKINLENIIIGKDKRTTLMLRNIPNKYTLQNLVDEINPSFWGKYDYINLPIDYERKLNLGYAFINFVDPLHIVNFFETYHLKKWSRYRSDKKIELNYAEKQGKKDITCKDENTYFALEDKKINFKKLNPKLEMPMKYFDFFKKIYPNSVCIVDKKISIMGMDKTFHIKSLGKK